MSGWRECAAALIPCAARCPGAEGLPSHSAACQDQRELALAFLDPIVAAERSRAKAEALRDVRAKFRITGTYRGSQCRAFLEHAARWAERVRHADALLALPNDVDIPEVFR